MRARIDAPLVAGVADALAAQARATAKVEEELHAGRQGATRQRRRCSTQACASEPSARRREARAARARAPSVAPVHGALAVSCAHSAPQH